MDFHRNSLTENNELLTACTRNRSFSAKSKLCAFSKVPFQTEIEVFLIRHFLYPLTVIAAWVGQLQQNASALEKYYTEIL